MGETVPQRVSAPRIASLQDLLGLWRGDEESCGFAHEGLAREICRKLKPLSELELFQQLYPGLEPADVEAEFRRVVSKAFLKWKAETP